MPRVKTKIEKIKVGDTVCTPGDHKVRYVCGTIHRIDRDGRITSFCSRDWASESAKKYSKDPIGCYTALKGESLLVEKPKGK